MNNAVIGCPLFSLFGHILELVYLLPEVDRLVSIPPAAFRDRTIYNPEPSIVPDRTKKSLGLRFQDCRRCQIQTRNRDKLHSLETRNDSRKVVDRAQTRVG